MWKSLLLLAAILFHFRQAPQRFGRGKPNWGADLPHFATLFRAGTLIPCTSGIARKRQMG